MTSRESKEIALQVFMEVMGLANLPNCEPETISPEQVLSWNSMTHLRLIEKIESILGRTLLVEELLGIKDLGCVMQLFEMSDL